MPRSIASRYSASVATPTASTTSAARTEAAFAARPAFSGARSAPPTPSRSRPSAVFGIIGGWPGMIAVSAPNPESHASTPSAPIPAPATQHQRPARIIEDGPRHIGRHRRASDLPITSNVRPVARNRLADGWLSRRAFQVGA